jgi:1-acyl-sn-glycerol-3-phosphate acyltransferase
MTQETGWIGKLVSLMIRRTVRARFRKVYWRLPNEIPEHCIFATTHHGWHDGYLLFHVVTALNRPSLDWIQEFDAFPLFRYVGGMPFPADDPNRRAATLKKTIRVMRSEKRSLMLFAEGILHRPPEIWPIGKALDLIVKQVAGVSILPVSIKYDMSIHERPEAFIWIGEPVIVEELRDTLATQLTQIETALKQDQSIFTELAQGTLDVNERMDMRKIRKK